MWHQLGKNHLVLAAGFFYWKILSSNQCRTSSSSGTAHISWLTTAGWVYQTIQIDTFGFSIASRTVSIGQHTVWGHSTKSEWQVSWQTLGLVRTSVEILDLSRHRCNVEKSSDWNQYPEDCQAGSEHTLNGVEVTTHQTRICDSHHRNSFIYSFAMLYAGGQIERKKNSCLPIQLINLFQTTHSNYEARCGSFCADTENMQVNYVQVNQNKKQKSYLWK